MEVEAFNRGEMRGPDGQTQRLPHGAIDSAILQRVLFTESLPAGVGGVGRNDANRDIREPITRIIQAAGNTRNPDNFIPTEDQINGMKGQIMGFNAPMAELRFSTTVRDAATGLDINSAQEIFTSDLTKAHRSFRISPTGRCRITPSTKRASCTAGVGPHRRP